VVAGKAGTKTTFTGWLQPNDVKRAHGIIPHAAQDEQRLLLVCKGLNQAVIDWRPDLKVPTVTVHDGAFDPAVFAPAFDVSAGEIREHWNDRITLGLIKLAHAWYTGLGTGSIPEQYDGFSGPPPMMTRDVEQLLEIGRGFRPVVA
jgi:hypothetical protein